MYNCYNEGIQYLKEKLGTKEIGSGTNTKNSPNRVDSVYLKENIIEGSIEHLIHTLLRQYNYGIVVKKELYEILTELGVKLN